MVHAVDRPADDPALGPARHARQLAMPAAVARGLGSSDPVLRLGSTMSLTNLTDTRNFAAAERCERPSFTTSTTR